MYAKNYDPSYIGCKCTECKVTTKIQNSDVFFTCKKCKQVLEISKNKIITCDSFNYFSKYIEHAFKGTINHEKALAETKFNFIKNEFCNNPTYDYRIAEEEERTDY